MTIIDGVKPGERARLGPIEVRCACGRDHGNQQIETFEPIEAFCWEGAECGPLVPGGGQRRPDETTNHRTRLFPAEGETEFPTWRGECLRCGLYVRVRGDRLVNILDHWMPVGGAKIELAVIVRMAHVRR